MIWFSSSGPPTVQGSSSAGASTQVVALEDDPDADPPSAGGDDGGGDGARVDLLDRDVELVDRPVEEVHDDGLQVVGGPQHRWAEVHADTAAEPKPSLLLPGHGGHGATRTSAPGLVTP